MQNRISGMIILKIIIQIPINLSPPPLYRSSRRIIFFIIQRRPRSKTTQRQIQRKRLQKLQRRNPRLWTRVAGLVRIDSQEPHTVCGVVKVLRLVKLVVLGITMLRKAGRRLLR